MRSIGVNSYWAAGPEPPTFLTTGFLLSLSLHIFSNCFRTVCYHACKKKFVRSYKPLNPCSSEADYKTHVNSRPHRSLQCHKSASCSLTRHRFTNTAHSDICIAFAIACCYSLYSLRLLVSSLTSRSKNCRWCDAFKLRWINL